MPVTASFAAMSEGPNRDGKHRGDDREAPYPLSRLAAPISLVDAAREIERADQLIASTASAKLDVIAAQMHALRAQAEEVLREASHNAALHRAEARFVRRPGSVYHLYEKSDGARYWSLLSPAEWRGAPPHAYVGSFRLEADQSWTPLDQIAARDRARQPLGGLLAAALDPSDHDERKP